MKIDTEIRHVTNPGANLFLNLGFPEEGESRPSWSTRNAQHLKRLAGSHDAGSLVPLQ